MKTRMIATLTALTLAAIAATSIRAQEAEVTLEWQKPGYITDVIVVTAPRPEATEEVAFEGSQEVALAWQEPGYITDVIVVTASRAEVLEQARRSAFEAAKARDEWLHEWLRSGRGRFEFGMPTR